MALVRPFNLPITFWHSDNDLHLQSKTPCLNLYITAWKLLLRGEEGGHFFGFLYGFITFYIKKIPDNLLIS